jgi:hypothetical protein
MIARVHATNGALGVLSAAGCLDLHGRGSGGQLLPLRDVAHTELSVRCWLLGVHGGAGESTLARLFDGFAPAHHAWPIDPRAHARTRVTLCARTSFWGMTAVQTAMRDWSANRREDVDVLGLVLVADRPGQLPRPLRALQHSLAGATPHLWRLSWTERWALGEAPSYVNAPRTEVEALRLGLTAALRAAGKETKDG